MYCSSCGNKLPEEENVRFCDNCGAPVGGVVQEKREKVTSPIVETIKQIDVDAIKQVDYVGYKNKAVDNFLVCSLVLAGVELVSTFMTWVTFGQTGIGRAVLSSIGFSDTMNVYKFLSIQEDSLICVLLFFTLPVIGLALTVYSYLNRDENNKKCEKLGRIGILVMGIGVIFTYVFLASYGSSVNNELSYDLVSLSGGARLWLVCGILQVVLFVLVKKKTKQVK